MGAPELSVITICFNNLEELKQTCVSVDEQSRKPAEHLIIDGSNNEEILQWLTSQQQPAYRRFIHERDAGISDAFNKGIKNAKFPITHLLNSGDRYAGNGIIELIVPFFEKDNWLMWLHGKYIQHRGNVDVITGHPFNPTELWKGMRTVAHPTMFIRKEVYDRHGNYDSSLKIAMDYDMLVRMREERFIFIPEPLIYFAPGGASNLQFIKSLEEVKASHEKHLGKDWRQTAWQMRQRLLNWFMGTRLGGGWFRWKNKGKISDV